MPALPYFTRILKNTYKIDFAFIRGIRFDETATL